MLRSGLFGPCNTLRITRFDGFPRGDQPRGAVTRWEHLVSYLVFPNFGIQFWERGWYHTYHHWPTASEEHPPG